MLFAALLASTSVLTATLNGATTNVTIALLQLNRTDSMPHRMSETLDSCRSAAKNGADVIVLPRDWASAQDFDKFVELARTWHVSITYTALLPNRSSVVSVLGPDGNVLVSHLKSADTPNEPQPPTPDDVPEVVTLVTRRGVALEIGLLFDTDAEFPEAGRVLMRRGAELVLVPGHRRVPTFAAPSPEVAHTSPWLQTLGARALDIAAPVAWVNDAFDAMGASAVFNIDSTPLFPSDALTPTRTSIATIIGTIDMAVVRVAAHTRNWGDSYRRPAMYQRLCGFRKTPPLEASGEGFTLRVAMAQMMGQPTMAANLAEAEKYVRLAAAAGADIVITPEMASVGYSAMYAGDGAWTDRDPQVAFEWMALAMSVEDLRVQHFGALAKKLGLAVGISFLHQAEPMAVPRNSIALFDRHGELKYVYSKVHTCNFEAFEGLTAPGHSFPTVVLDTSKGEVVVGSMICYDREFAEPARALTLGGAEVILQPNACGIGAMHINVEAARAAENGVAVVLNNLAGPAPMNGHSGAWDHQGRAILTANASEGLFVASIDIAALRRHRGEARGRALINPLPMPEICGLHKDGRWAATNAFNRIAAAYI